MLLVMLVIAGAYIREGVIRYISISVLLMALLGLLLRNRQISEDR
jgi:hypothetical protein